MNLEKILLGMLNERRNDGVVRDILDDRETTEDFMSVLKETTEAMIGDNFDALFQFSLLKWVQILDEEDDNDKDMAELNDNIEDFISSDPDEVDVLQMKAMMEEG